MLFASVVQLSRRLRDAGLHITIETSGTLNLEGIACDLMSISPKLSTSGPPDDAKWQRRHEAARWRPDVIRKLIAQSNGYQIKFVVDRKDEQAEVIDVLHSLSDCVHAERVWIMPQAQTIEELDNRATWLKPWCDSHGYHFCDRMHLRWYGSGRAT